MKHINVAFDDEEFQELSRYKGDATWRELILSTLNMVKTISSGLVKIKIYCPICKQLTLATTGLEKLLEATYNKTAIKEEDKVYVSYPDNIIREKRGDNP